MTSNKTSDDLMLTAGRRREFRQLSALTMGHFASDLYQGAIPALLPYLVLLHGLSLSSASLMVLAFTVTASITQPVFGWLADRTEVTWLTVAGLIVCGSSFALLVAMSDLLGLVILAGVCGCGNAAFHPQAARDVTRLLRHRSSLALSIFMVGGQGGFAVGPIVLAIALSSFGPGGAVVLLLPALIAAGAIFWQHTPALQRARESNQAHASGETLPMPNNWRAFGILMGIVLIWSVLSVGTYSFLGLYWTLELGQSAASANIALTIMLIAGVAGMIAGSWLADRSNAMLVVGGSFALCIVSFILLSVASNPWSAQLAAVLLGISVYSPFAVMVVLGQRFLPRSTGMASGVTMGLSMSIGGLAAPGLGFIAESYGFFELFALLATGASIAGGLSLWLGRVMGRQIEPI